MIDHIVALVEAKAEAMRDKTALPEAAA